MISRYDNKVPCWASGREVLWCLCRLLSTHPLNASADATHLLVGLSPIVKPSSTNGYFLPLNVDYFPWWMIILSWMDLLSLEAQAGMELEGGEAAGEESWAFLSQSGSVLGHLALCSLVHRTSPFRSGSEIRKNHAFSYLRRSHLHFALLQWLIVHSEQEKQSRSHKEMYPSRDKKRR